MVYWVYSLESHQRDSLESPRRGDSNEYTQNTMPWWSKKISLYICFLSCRKKFQGTKNEFEFAMVNESSRFELLRFELLSFEPLRFVCSLNFSSCFLFIVLRRFVCCSSFLFMCRVLQLCRLLMVCTVFHTSSSFQAYQQGTKSPHTTYVITMIKAQYFVSY